MAASLRTNTLSFQEAHEWFFYDFETGKLHWKLRPSRRARWGTEAGSINIDGYIRLELKGKEYRAHNIVWIMNGNQLPDGKTVDHIDQCKTNNRISNLRLANDRQQMMNKMTRGFYWSKRRQKWQTQHKVNSKQYWLGYFKTALQARLRYEQHTAEQEPEFATTTFTDALRELCSDGYQINWQPSCWR